MSPKLTDADIELRCAKLRDEYLKLVAAATDPKERAYFKLSAEVQPAVERWSFMATDEGCLSNGDLCDIFTQQIASLFIQFFTGTKMPEQYWPSALVSMLGAVPPLALDQAKNLQAIDVPRAN